MGGLSGAVLVRPNISDAFFYLSYPLWSDLGTGNPLPNFPRRRGTVPTDSFARKFET